MICVPTVRGETYLESRGYLIHRNHPDVSAHPSICCATQSCATMRWTRETYTSWYTMWRAVYLEPANLLGVTSTVESYDKLTVTTIRFASNQLRRRIMIWVRKRAVVATQARVKKKTLVIRYKLELSRIGFLHAEEVFSSMENISLGKHATFRQSCTAKS